MKKTGVLSILGMCVVALLGTPLSFVLAKPIKTTPPIHSSVTQALELLDQSAKAYGALEGVSMHMTYRVHDDGDVFKGQGMISYEKSGRSRITHSAIPEPLIYPIASNDTRVAKAALARNIQSAGGLAGLLLTSLVQGHNPLRQPMVKSVLMDEKFTWGKKPRLLPRHGVAVLLVAPEDSEYPTMEVTMYFDAKDNLLRRIETKGQHAGRKFYQSVTFSNVRINPQFAAGTFDKPKSELKSTPRINWDSKLVVGSEPYALQGVNLEDYRGKVVLLEFWATWCSPCVKEVPWLLSSYQKHADEGFVIIGISRDKDKKALADFIKARKLPWLQVFDTGYGQSSNAARYGVKAIPFALLIGKDGKIAAVNPRGAALEPALEKALAQSAP